MALLADPYTATYQNGVTLVQDKDTRVVQMFYYLINVSTEVQTLVCMATVRQAGYNRTNRHIMQI